MYIKFFLIQKSKSSTTLNDKEEKQKEATISQSISDSWGKNISSVLYPCDNFPAGQFSFGQFVGGAII